MATTTIYRSIRPVGYFLRHLGEMILAMLVGMVASVAVLALLFSTVLASTNRGMPCVEVLNQFAVLICLVMAVGMIVPMVAWMRYRGMEWRRRWCSPWSRSSACSPCRSFLALGPAGCIAP